MKAWELQDRGFDNLRLVERPTPRPGPHDLLVRVSAVSLNHRDEDIILGWLGAIGQDPLDESMRARRRPRKARPWVNAAAYRARPRTAASTALTRG